MEDNKDIKKEKIDVSDDTALAIFNKLDSTYAKVATKFVTRTIVYPAIMEYKPGVKTTEIRTFVRMHEWVSPAQWEKALRLEKKYAKLNKAYTDRLKSLGLPTSIKEPGNLLNATVLDINK
jgi:hypothetical protein